jgi:hypothetical protein
VDHVFQEVGGAGQPCGSIVKVAGLHARARRRKRGVTARVLDGQHAQAVVEGGVLVAAPIAQRLMHVIRGQLLRLLLLLLRHCGRWHSARDAELISMLLRLVALRHGTRQLRWLHPPASGCAAGDYAASTATTPALPQSVHCVHISGGGDQSRM